MPYARRGSTRKAGLRKWRRRRGGPDGGPSFDAEERTAPRPKKDVAARGRSQNRPNACIS